MIITMMMNLVSGMMGIKNARPKKQKIKEELLTIAWHPSTWQDWCVPEDKKGIQKNCGSNR